ncbi:hypothetical protein LOTGIDRAFT_178675 [Lottia gigantea]|uniref:RCC1-like domain-containing protein n=1 Tax=Lottia gigantea TaxID=225164 RepID=V4ABC9_LOTGI|nr:hypothetical protein LOTGIDRAFT_178675 [Lottia gigantea]ESO92365.1 hypothetical protein LOTGIDRAFT_178675 [Lottia gigantea]
MEDVPPLVKVEHRSHSSPKDVGVVLTLGEGDVGQLGLGEDVMEKSRPGLVDIPDTIIQVVAGGMHTVCLTDKGEIYSFGCNDEGGLGRDTSVEGSETEPGKVELPHRIVQISAGDSHTAALTEYGEVYAWGNFRDANGSIGLTKSGIEKFPILMFSEERVVKIASGVDHLVCLTEQGLLYTSGCAEQGQLGRLAECFTNRGGRKGIEYLLNPRVVRCKKYRTRRLAKFSDVWTGQYVTFAEEEETGEIYGWGLNNYYQLGFEDMENKFHPQRIKSFCREEGKWTMISGGQHHTIALDSNGKVYSLGRSDYGRLGLGENCGEKFSPTRITALDSKNCNYIDAGGCASFAVDDQGDVYAWGMGTSKQLGNGSEDDLFVPQKMEGKQLQSRKCLKVSGGGQHTVLLAKNNDS